MFFEEAEKVRAGEASLVSTEQTAATESWEDYFIRKCGEIPILSHLLEEAEYREGSFAKIQDYSYRSKQVAGPGFFLIGDAAGFNWGNSTASL